MRMSYSTDTAMTVMPTVSLHDALPIYHSGFADDDGFRFLHALIRDAAYAEVPKGVRTELHARFAAWLDRKSTRLNSSHELISYAVFCLKKKHHTRLQLARLVAHGGAVR